MKVAFRNAEILETEIEREDSKVLENFRLETLKYRGIYRWNIFDPQYLTILVKISRNPKRGTLG